MSAGVDEVLAGGYAASGAGVGVAVAAARHRLDGGGTAGTRPWLPVLLSLHACGWLYACTPDTELARLLIGFTAAVGAAAIALRQRWAEPAQAITAALVVASVLDGWARDSAVVGGIGVAVVHALAQHRPGGPRRATELAVVVWASAVCSRSAGLGPGLARPVAVAAVAVGVVAVVLVVLPGRRRRAAIGGPG